MEENSQLEIKSQSSDHEIDKLKEQIKELNEKLNVNFKFYYFLY